MDDAADGFEALGLRPELVATLTELGYEEPTPIQREAIPAMLAGGDVLGQAATGTGKTAAFALPILDALANAGGQRQRGDDPTALVLVPTRELAMQVCEAMYRYGKAIEARSVPVYGGQPIYRQLQALGRGADVVVATPGRALDHLRRGSIDYTKIRYVVLDEADEMLDMGFAEDIEALLSATSSERQTVLFSATMPPRIASIARQHLRNPQTIRIERAAASESSAEVAHTAYVVARAHKAAALGRILDVEAPGAAIVFCRTRTEVDQLTETLNGRGYRAEALHGGMDQEQRDRVMGRMRSATAELLIATDVAARGLDLDHLTHVVNYDVPSSPEVYVHRVGRVGRAGRSGTAMTLAEPREQRQLANIERIVKLPITIAKVPSVADLRSRQAEITETALRNALTAGDDESFANLVELLSDEFEVEDIARAAIALFHEAAGNIVDTEEIPEAYVRPRDDRFAGRGDDKRSSRPGRDFGDKPRYNDRTTGGDHGPAAKVMINIGRDANVSPGDLVGAIANETGLSGRQIGPIKINQKNSVVGVPVESVDAVIAALMNTSVRGRRVKARRYVDDERETRPRPQPRPGHAGAVNVRRSSGANSSADRPQRWGGDRPSGDRPGGDRPGGDRPGGDRRGNERKGGRW